MQDIVYKLVPGMQTEEQRRREQFKQRQRVKEVREQNGHSNGTSTSAGTESLSNSTNEEPKGFFGDFIVYISFIIIQRRTLRMNKMVAAAISKNLGGMHTGE